MSKSKKRKILVLLGVILTLILGIIIILMSSSLFDDQNAEFSSIKNDSSMIHDLKDQDYVGAVNIIQRYEEFPPNSEVGKKALKLDVDYFLPRIESGIESLNNEKELLSNVDCSKTDNESDCSNYKKQIDVALVEYIEAKEKIENMDV